MPPDVDGIKTANKDDQAANQCSFLNVLWPVHLYQNLAISGGLEHPGRLGHPFCATILFKRQFLQGRSKWSG